MTEAGNQSITNDAGGREAVLFRYMAWVEAERAALRAHPLWCFALSDTGLVAIDEGLVGAFDPSTAEVRAELILAAAGQSLEPTHGAVALVRRH